MPAPIAAAPDLNQHIASARQRGASSQYLLCMAGPDLLAISVLAVREIIECHGITTVPMMPPCVRGIINLRGAVVPVLDLNARFGRALTVRTRRTCIVVVELVQADGGAGHQVLGLMVDAVQAVTDIALDDVEAAPAFGLSIGSAYLDGMARLPGQQGRFAFLLKLAPLALVDDDAVPAAAADYLHCLPGTAAAAPATSHANGVSP